MCKKYRKFIVLLLLICGLLSGCWDAADVSTLNLCTMVILDKQEETFSFVVEIVQILPAGESGGSGGKKQTYLTGSGANLAEARDGVDMQMDNPLFLGTVRALVITERAAADDLAEYLFRLRENQSYRQKVNIAIVSEEPQALTEFENEASQPLGFVIDDTIHTGQALGHTCAVTTEKYVNNILAHKDFIIQHLRLADKQIRLDGYSVFRDAKLVGFIPMENSRGLSYMLAGQPIWVYRLPSGDGFVTTEVTLTRRSIQPALQDGQISFQVQLAFEAIIQYSSEVALFPLNDQGIRAYSDKLNQVLAEEVRAAIALSQTQFQSDYLEFGDTFRLTFPDAFERMDWSAEYPQAQIHVATSLHVLVSDKIDIKSSE